MSSGTIYQTDLKFPVPFTRYGGKVRDVYNLNEELLVIVATDRISAFDVILPRQIPFKGQVLNQTAQHFLESTTDIVANHAIDFPDPNVTIGLRCQPIPVEFVIRGYLAGHAWRLYSAGERMVCGVKLPDGLKQHDKLPEPILTPATKSAIGHDEDITEREIIKSGLMEADELEEVKHYALKLYERGSSMAAEKGLILVDTKYEFGTYQDRIVLIDEIHTPDSSRYFYKEGYEEKQEKELPQQQLSKEFVREWLMENGFQGKDTQEMPEMPDEFVERVSKRYIELFEQVTGKTFEPADTNNIEQRIRDNVFASLEKLGMKVS